MPAPNRFNMLNFKMHISCVALCGILAYIVDMQCSAVCCCCCCCCRSPFLTQIIIISLDSSSLLSCFLMLPAIGTGSFVHPLAQCQRCTWSDSTNLTSKWYTRCMRMYTAMRRNYILFIALKCLNFSFLSFSLSKVVSFKFLFRLLIVWLHGFNIVVVIVNKLLDFCVLFWQFNCLSKILVHIQVFEQRKLSGKMHLLNDKHCIELKTQTLFMLCLNELSKQNW